MGEAAPKASASCDFVQDVRFHLGEVLDANLLDLSDSYWCWRRLGAQQLSLVNLPVAVLNSRQLNALAERDKSRWERAQVDPTIEEDPGKWSFSTIPFAATHVWDMPPLRIGAERPDFCTVATGRSMRRPSQQSPGRSGPSPQNAHNVEWKKALKITGFDAAISQSLCQSVSRPSRPWRPPSAPLPRHSVDQLSGLWKWQRMWTGSDSVLATGPLGIYSRWTSRMYWNASRQRTFCERYTTRWHWWLVTYGMSALVSELSSASHLYCDRSHC